MHVAGEPRAHGQTVHQQQPAAMLTIRILDDPRFRRAAVVSHGYMQHRLLPGELHGEEPATPARGVPQRVTPEFGGDADDIVARGTFWQQRRQPPPYRTKLTLLSFEHASPPERTCRNCQWRSVALAGLAVRAMRLTSVGVASHWQASSRHVLSGSTSRSVAVWQRNGYRP
jgi:hypothetical protein